MSSKKKKKKPVVRFYVDFKLKYEHLLQQRTPGQCVCVPACQKVLKKRASKCWIQVSRLKRQIWETASHMRQRRQRAAPASWCLCVWYSGIINRNHRYLHGDRDKSWKRQKGKHSSAVTQYAMDPFSNIPSCFCVHVRFLCGTRAGE